MRKSIFYFVLVMSINFLSSCNGDDDFDPNNPDNVGTYTDDRDGKVYTTLKLGEITWMKENLGYDAGAGSWMYENDDFYLNSYGRLYTWEIASTVCPEGWELPSNDDWELLALMVSEDHGGVEKDGQHWLHIAENLKAESGWVQNNGTDDYGFLAYAGGMRYADNTFDFTGINGFWWSIDGYDEVEAWYWSMDAESQTLFNYIGEKEYAFSVRCISREIIDDSNPIETVITTLNATDILATSATLNGKIESGNSASFTKFGFYWGVDENMQEVQVETETEGVFSFQLTDLSPTTDYWYYAFATTGSGNVEGFLLSFKTDCGDEGQKIPTDDDYGSFMDQRDNISYKTVKIGNQTWMAENLAYYHGEYNCWAYMNDESYVEDYGRLYSWETAMESCPSGWHLPSNGEWEELAEFINGDNCGFTKWDSGTWTGVGNKLKSDTTWAENGNGTNEYGFSALAGGRNYSGAFDALGQFGTYWTSTSSQEGYAYRRNFSYNSDYLMVGEDQTFYGYSVRCIKD